MKPTGEILLTTFLKLLLHGTLSLFQIAWHFLGHFTIYFLRHKQEVSHIHKLQVQ